jgi:hypothetical protein
MQLDIFLAGVLRLANGIMAIQDPGSPVEFADAVKWATAAIYNAEKNGLDPYELVAIARNESDFRPNLVGPDGKDCGITQTRVTYSKYSCKRLKADTWVAFEEAARELTIFQTYCLQTHRGDLTRCRLNGYNQGYRYALSGWKGSYYARIRCFADAARAGVTPSGNCRWARTPRDIAWLIRPRVAEAAPIKPAQRAR